MCQSFLSLFKHETGSLIGPRICHFMFKSSIFNLDICPPLILKIPLLSCSFFSLRITHLTNLQCFCRPIWPKLQTKIAHYFVHIASNLEIYLSSKVLKYQEHDLSLIKSILDRHDKKAFCFCLFHSNSLDLALVIHYASPTTLQALQYIWVSLH